MSGVLATPAIIPLLGVIDNMPTPIPGVHHVTAIASDPVENLEFYTDILGLRLVKQSVNQDDATTYHLFYADHHGSPGTSMTFFPYTDSRPGQVGTGQVHTTQFLIPRDAVEWWVDRLEDRLADGVETTTRFDEDVIRFSDPDGLKLELVGIDGAPEGHPPDGPVPAEYSIRGFHGVTLAVQSPGRIPDLLDTMGYDREVDEEDVIRFRASGELGAVVDLAVLESGPRGQPGTGTVHHVAFRVGDTEQAEWREILVNEGLRPTEIIDRKWFKSVYTRTPAGILFEFATPSPGYTVDEDLESLGSELVLPEWLEPKRENIESVLPDLPDPGF